MYICFVFTDSSIAPTLEQWSGLDLGTLRSLTSCALYMRIMIPSFRMNGWRNLRESLLFITTLLPRRLISLRIMFYVPSSELAYPECALSASQWGQLDENLKRFTILSELHIGFEIRSILTRVGGSTPWSCEMTERMQRYIPHVYGTICCTLLQVTES